MVDHDRLQHRLELLRGSLTELRRLRDLASRDYLREASWGRYLVQVSCDGGRTRSAVAPLRGDCGRWQPLVVQEHDQGLPP